MNRLTIIDRKTDYEFRVFSEDDDRLVSITVLIPTEGIRMDIPLANLALDSIQRDLENRGYISQETEVKLMALIKTYAGKKGL